MITRNIGGIMKEAYIANIMQSEGLERKEAVRAWVLRKKEDQELETKKAILNGNPV